MAAQMKVVAFNGSARKNGNTAALIRQAFVPLEHEGVETEQVEMAGSDIRGCIACMKCFKNQDRRCAGRDDDANGFIAKMREADGIILASPTYFATVSTELKALIDRAGLVSKANGDMLKRKVGAAVVAARRGGAIHTFDAINHFFFISQMIVPGSVYWNMGFGQDKGEVGKDEEGLQTMTVLGRNMAWLMQRIAG